MIETTAISHYKKKILVLLKVFTPRPSKLGCVVVDSILPQAGYGQDDHRKYIINTVKNTGVYFEMNVMSSGSLVKNSMNDISRSPSRSTVLNIVFFKFKPNTPLVLINDL